MDLNYYYQSLEMQEDGLWTTKQLLREFAEFEKDTATFWQDNAYRFFQSRYYIPLSASHETMQVQLSSHQAMGKHCHLLFEKIIKQLELAESETLNAERCQLDAENEMKSYEYYQHQFLEDNEKANLHEQRSRELIAASNKHVNPL